MAEHYNSRTVEIRYRKEPDAQKLLIIDATCVEPNEAVVVVVTRGAMVQRRFKPEGGACLESAITEILGDQKMSEPERSDISGPATPANEHLGDNDVVVHIYGKWGDFYRIKYQSRENLGDKLRVLRQAISILETDYQRARILGQ